MRQRSCGTAGPSHHPRCSTVSSCGSGRREPRVRATISRAGPVPAELLRGKQRKRAWPSTRSWCAPSKGSWEGCGASGEGLVPDGVSEEVSGADAALAGDHPGAADGPANSASTGTREKPTKKSDDVERILAGLEMEDAYQSKGGNVGGRLGRQGANAAASFEQRLKAYREVKDELREWTESFQHRHGQQPTLEDAEATGTPWIVATYKMYMLLRIQLFQELRELRDKLEPQNTAFMARKSKRRGQRQRSPAGNDVLAAFSYLKRGGTEGTSAGAPAQVPVRSAGDRISSAFAAANRYKSGEGIDAAASAGGESRGRGADADRLLNLARAQTTSSDPSGRLGAAFRAAAQYKKSAAAPSTGLEDDSRCEPGAEGTVGEGETASAPLDSGGDSASSDPAASRVDSLLDVARAQSSSSDPDGRIAAAFAAAAAYKKRK